MRRILFVFEFPPGDAEWQLRDLAQGLRRQDPSIDIAFCSGWFERYAPGGLRLGRMANGIWVHVAAFFRILFGKYDAVLVRSAPPLIQMTVAMACRLRRLPYWVWLMDAHPEIEAELWRRKPLLSFLCTRLEKLNARCLARAALVIVLDPGMQHRLVPHLNEECVIVCPTWGRTAGALA